MYKSKDIDIDTLKDVVSIVYPTHSLIRDRNGDYIIIYCTYSNSTNGNIIEIGRGYTEREAYYDATRRK